MTLAPGHIRLVWPTGTLDLLLGETSPRVLSGYSTFNEIARPKRSTAIEYTGKELFRLEIPVLIDGWLSGTSVEGIIQQIEELAVSRGGKGNPPQDFRVDGPIPHRDVQWMIEGLDWGDAIYDGDIRLRQFLTLTLVQKLDMPYLLRNGNDAPRAVTPGWRVVKTRDGDLRRLAQTMLGDSRLWRRIRKKNGDPFRDFLVPKNTTVRVPR